MTGRYEARPGGRAGDVERSARATKPRKPTRREQVKAEAREAGLTVAETDDETTEERKQQHDHD
jgi:alpha-D-ribose 1-methylphosphonate 5-triphosphate diphosphatase PhnM